MTELLTAAQMRAIEQAAIESGDVTGLELMERAGAGVVKAVFEEWSELDEGTRRALVLCGPGNNGGDGFVVARLLKERGWEVEVFLYGDAEKLPPDARANYERWCEMGTVASWSRDLIAAAARPDLILDAVFGIGLTRPLPPEVAEVLDIKFKQVWRNSVRIKTVAVDCPSGLNLDTGFIPTQANPDDPDFDPWPKTLNMVDLTVTFHTPKPGHYLAMGSGLCRRLRVADIGLRGDAMERRIIGLPPEPDRARLVEGKHLGANGLTELKPRFWPCSQLGKFRGGGHKYDYGHVAVFAGGVGRGGAARMAARAALRAGAGLVTVFCPPGALQENACQLNAIMLRAVRDADQLSEVADDRVSAFCMGPGMGVSERTISLVSAVLARRGGDRDWRDPVVVLDADALTSFAENPQALFDMTHARTILTPHDGEFARLFPDLAKALRHGASRIDIVRQASARAGCIVLLKGEATVIAQPDGGAALHAALYDRTTPWLATAGAGDVLAGLITGLAAPGATGDLFNLAEAAAWLHVECARSFGPGLIAEDLPEELPKVFRSLGL